VRYTDGFCRLKMWKRLRQLEWLGYFSTWRIEILEKEEVANRVWVLNRGHDCC
jgi:hypothetical protein